MEKNACHGGCRTLTMAKSWGIPFVANMAVGVFAIDFIPPGAAKGWGSEVRSLPRNLRKINFLSVISRKFFWNIQGPPAGVRKVCAVHCSVPR